MPVKAIKNHIIFKFNDEIVRKTDTGRERTQFVDSTEWGFEISNYDEGTKTPRWVTVISVGPEVVDTIKVGSKILVEALQWTESIEVDGEPHWRTDEDKIILVDEGGLIPLQDRVIIARSKNNAVSTGGIVISSAPDEKSTEGEILAIGCGKTTETGKLIRLDVKIGDRVVFGELSGVSAKIKGKVLLFLREEDILGILI